MTEGYCSLAELCENEITDGTHQTPVYSEQGYIFLSSKDVTGGVIDWEHVKHIPENLHKELYARVKPQVDDILLAKNGTTGIAALVDRDEVFDIYVSLALIRPDKSKVIPQYLLYAINSQKTQEFFKRNLKGIGVPNLHLTHIRETPIKLHPKAVQKKIIEKLGYQELATATEELVKSRFVEMFGDPISNSQNLPDEALGDICLLKAGITTSPKEIKEQEDDEYNVPCYGGNGVRGFVKTASYHGEYPIIGRQGALCGNVQFARGDFHATEHAVLVTPKIPFNPIWLYLVLREMNLNRFQTGAAQPGLAVKTLNSVRIITPPITLQNQFADFVALTDKSKIAIQKSIRLLELLKASLMQTYFG